MHINIQACAQVPSSSADQTYDDIAPPEEIGVSVMRIEDEDGWLKQLKKKMTIVCQYCMSNLKRDFC